MFNEIGIDWFAVCILGAIITGIVELFYGFRLYSFSRSKAVTAVITCVRSFNPPRFTHHVLLAGSSSDYLWAYTGRSQ